MIFVQTNLMVADNSGALKVRCIKVLNNKTLGNPGDIILVSLKKINPKKKLLKGNIIKGVIVRVKRKIYRNDGSYICTGENAIVILNNNFLPIGTRIFGPIMRELRFTRNFNKIMSLAKFIV